MNNLFFCLLAMPVFAFEGLGEGFYGVHSPNGVDVWGVGKAGNVFHSYDGGVTWSSDTRGSVDLRAVCSMGSTVWIVGDNGVYHTSTDNGNTWSSGTLNGGTTLRAIAFSDLSTGWVAGNNGTILRTTNGGAAWLDQASTTSQTINSIAFEDALTGYVAGNSGTLLKTTDGGSTWLNTAGSGWSKDINAVSARTGKVLVVGYEGFCFMSTNGGSSWSELNFKTDSQSDVNDVFIKNDGSVYFTGGGGYIRKSATGSAPYQWATHSLHAKVNDIFFIDNLRGWACSEKNNVILRTTDGGLNWVMPQGTSVSYSWSQKLSVSATVRGNAFALNPYNKNAVYCALGNRVYASYNLGETWVQIATITLSGSKVNSFYVSPKDTNVWVAAFGSPDGIARTTDRGVTWTQTIARAFTEYGMPLEMDGSHPDTLIFGPEDSYFYRSTDFGATWTQFSQPFFRSPCDLVIVRDVPEILWCGDGITGSGNGVMFKSRDGGLTWDSVFVTSGSEIPTIGSSGLDNTLGYATAWGSGGVRRTKDHGDTWTSVASTGSTWGVDIAKDDPNVVMYGVYGGGTSYLSIDGGTTFTTSSLTGSNYAILCYDRATFLTQQSGGIYKYTISYTVPTSNVQIVTVLSPNGGESWQYNTIQNITWTAGNILNVNIEYKTSPGSSWQLIAASVPSGNGSFAWLVPNTPTSQARVRVSDSADGNPVDSSNGYFTITSSSISTQPASLDFGPVGVGSSRMDTIRIFNGGTGTLVISSVSTNSSVFIPGRTSFTIPPMSSDTMSVVFSPPVIQTYNDTLLISSNAPGSATLVPLAGQGDDPNTVPEVTVPTTYALEQNYPNPFNPTTSITYSIPEAGHVSVKVYNTLGQEVSALVNRVQAAGKYSVSFGAKSSSGDPLSSGIYFYRLSVAPEAKTSQGFVDMKKMILVK